MAAVKSYTDIEQSRKLAEILSPESADTLHCIDFDGDLLYTVPKQYSGSFRYQPELTIPCWSLSALLDILPYPSLHKTFSGWRCDSYDKEGKTCRLGENADNPVDACVVIIEKLYKLNLL